MHLYMNYFIWSSGERRSVSAFLKKVVYTVKTMRMMMTIPWVVLPRQPMLILGTAVRSQAPFLRRMKTGTITTTLPALQTILIVVTMVAIRRNHGNCLHPLPPPSLTSGHFPRPEVVPTPGHNIPTRLVA